MGNAPAPPPEFGGPPAPPGGPASPTTNRQPLIIGAAVLVVAAIIVGVVVMSGGDDGGSAEGGGSLSDEIQITLKEAATAEEGYIVDNGEYTNNVGDLSEYGFSPYPGTTITSITADGSSYCIEASDDLGTTAHFDSDVGAPEEGGC